jgi:hypothetical protein
MKLFSLTLLSFVATATAFAPQGAAQSSCRSTSNGSCSALNMVPDEFAQSEIDSNDVSTANDLRNISQQWVYLQYY